MKHLSDEAIYIYLLEGRGRKKQKAFNCLYSRYCTSVKQYFYFSFNCDVQRSEDFCQDLFMKILEHPEKFDVSKVFKAWLFRVASNMVKNHFRSLEVQNKYTQHVLHSEKDIVELKVNERSVREGIKKLSEEQRAVMVMRFKLNMSIKEISEVFECPEGTVKSRLFYATKELSKKLEKQEVKMDSNYQKRLL